MRDKTIGVLGFGLLLIVALFAAFAVEKSNQSRIENWCDENNYEAIIIDRKHFDDGPFWFTDFDEQSVYRVETMNLHNERKRVCWFRFGLFMEHKWEDEE